MIKFYRYDDDMFLSMNVIISGINLARDYKKSKYHSFLPLFDEFSFVCITVQTNFYPCTECVKE